MSTARVEIESLSIITYVEVHVHGISDFTVAKRPNIFPARITDQASCVVGAIGTFQMWAWGPRPPQKVPLQWLSLTSLQVRPPTNDFTRPLESTFRLEVPYTYTIIVRNMLAYGKLSNRRISIKNMAVPPGRVQCSASSFVGPSNAASLMKLYCSTWCWIEIWLPR